MHTTCLLAVSPNMHCTGGESAPGGGVSVPRGLSAPGGLLHPSMH